jgi:hypothetical protein
MKLSGITMKDISFGGIASADSEAGFYKLRLWKVHEHQLVFERLLKSSSSRWVSFHKYINPQFRSPPS